MASCSSGFSRRQTWRLLESSCVTFIAAAGFAFRYLSIILSSLSAGQVVAPAAGRGPCSRSSSAQRGCASCRRRSSGSGARGSPSTSRGACCGDSDGAAQGAAGRGGGAAAAFGRLRCGVHDGGIGVRPAAARRRQLRRVILGTLQMIHTPADPRLWQQPAQC